MIGWVKVQRVAGGWIGVLMGGGCMEGRVGAQVSRSIMGFAQHRFEPVHCFRASVAGETSTVQLCQIAMWLFPPS